MRADLDSHKKIKPAPPIAHPACLDFCSEFGQPQPCRTWKTSLDLLFDLGSNFRCHIHPALIEEIKDVLFLEVEPLAAHFSSLFPISLIEKCFKLFQCPIGVISQ